MWKMPLANWMDAVEVQPLIKWIIKEIGGINVYFLVVCIQQKFRSNEILCQKRGLCQVPQLIALPLTKNIRRSY